MNSQSDFEVVVNRRKKGFTQVYNHFLEDVTLSWKAKGIFIYILSRPHGWKLNIKGDVSKRSTDKERAIYSGIKELVDRGYISRTRNSEFYITYHFFEFVEDNNIPDYLLSREQNSDEVSHSQNAHVQNADMRNAHVQNSNDLIRPKDSNTECNNNDIKQYGITDAETEKIVEIWNSILNVPNIRSLSKTSARYKALNARYKEHGIEVILEMLMLVRTSRFLQGDNKENWMPNFGWVLNPENFIKVLEGTYNKDKRVNHERSNSNNQATPKLSTFQQRAIALSKSVDENRHILDELPDDHRF